MLPIGNFAERLRRIGASRLEPPGNPARAPPYQAGAEGIDRKPTARR
jgi:hypothetical protein